MIFFDTFFADIRYRVLAISFTDLLDVLLVTYIFYVLIVFLRETKAVVLIRGALYLLLALVGLNVILPLPTLNWVIGAVVLTLMIATPITLQPELRRAFEQLGRYALFSFRKRTEVDKLANRLVATLRRLGNGKTGALIVLQGQDSLSEFVHNGVAINGEMSDELLRTLFFDKTPLHDGAVILEESYLLAAGCVLPLAEGEAKDRNRRLGTRHRAALGLSESTDALVFVVSEETGQIAFAQNSRLNTQQSDEELVQAIEEFYQKPREQSRLRRIHFTGRFVWSAVNAALIAMLLALVAWVAVINNTNPLVSGNIDNIILRVEALPENMQVESILPGTVALDVRTTEAILEGLSEASFQATVDLTDAVPGLQRVPIQVQSPIANIQRLQTYPGFIDIELVQIVEKELPVTIEVIDTELLPVVFQLNGAPSTTLTNVSVSGPAPKVNVVATVTAELSVANATATQRRSVTLVPRDSAGVVVANVTLSPTSIELVQRISRRQDVREMAINALTTGLSADGYWLSSLSSTPSSITLQGDPALLQSLSNFVNTLPVDISEIYGNAAIVVPLDLPAGTRAFDTGGVPITNVELLIGISARQGDLLLSIPIEIQNQGDKTVELDGDSVEILLSGPLPLLREIEANLELVKALIDIHDLPLNQAIAVVPRIVVPEGISFQLINSLLSINIRP